MDTRIAQGTTRFASGCATFWTALRDAWRTTGGGGSYRPEAHYMRGPGPAWRAKYGQVSALKVAKR